MTEQTNNIDNLFGVKCEHKTGKVEVKLVDKGKTFFLYVLICECGHRDMLRVRFEKNKTFAFLTPLNVFRKPCEYNLKKAKEIYRGLLLLKGYRVVEVLAKEMFPGYFLKPFLDNN